MTYNTLGVAGLKHYGNKFNMDDPDLPDPDDREPTEEDREDIKTEIPQRYDA